MNSKKNNVISESYKFFFGPKKALAVSINKNDCSLIRNLLKNIQIHSNNIFIANDYQSACKIMEDQTPEVMITDYKLDGYCGLDLFDFHMNIHPNRLNAIFSIVTDDISPELRCKLAEGEIDSIIPKPLSPNGLKDKFLENIHNKINPSEYEIKLEEGKELYRRGKKQKAIEIFRWAKKMHMTPIVALYYEGLIHKSRRNQEEAINCFLNGAQFATDESNVHYGCLHELLDIYIEQKMYSEAHQINSLLVRNFPLDPTKIPGLIEMSLQLENFDDIMDYEGVFLKSKNNNTNIQYRLATGLIDAGKKLTEKKESQKAMNFFKKAAYLSKGREDIVINVIKGLMKMQAYEYAYKILNDLTTDTKSLKLKEIKLDIFEHLNKDPNEILKLGMELLQHGIKSLKVYMIVIKRSKQLGRRKDLIDDLIYEAKKRYPGLDI